MSDSRESIKNEIDELIKKGILIFDRNDPNIHKENIKYQIWYTTAISVVKTLIPERLDEFNRLYKLDKQVNHDDPEYYTIRDYLLGKELYIKQNSFPKMNLKFNQQLAILKSAQTRIDPILADIKGVLQADIFDNEIGASESLLKSKHYRAAGTLAGVVLESHLGEVCSNHSIKFKKKNLTIADYNDALKDNDILDLSKWRKIQALTDIRNLCSHKKERNPNRDDVEELIEGVKKVTKTIF